jgi:hypothetical protein
MNTFHRVLFFISALMLTAGTGHDSRYSLDLSVRCKGKVKLREEELLAYFGKDSYDFGIGIPSLRAINSSSVF